MASPPSARSPSTPPSPYGTSSSSSSGGSGETPKSRKAVLQFRPRSQQMQHYMEQQGINPKLQLKVPNNRSLASIIDHLTDKWLRGATNSSRICLWPRSSSPHLTDGMPLTKFSSTKHGLTIKVYDFFADQNATQFPVLLDYDWSMESYSNEASPFDNFDEINASPISPPLSKQQQQPLIVLDEESRSLQELKALLESACTTVADNSSSSFISQSPVKLASVPSPPRSALEPLKLNSAASTDLFKAVPADDVISSLRKSNSVKRSRTEEPSSDLFDLAPSSPLKSSSSLGLSSSSAPPSPSSIYDPASRSPLKRRFTESDASHFAAHTASDENFLMDLISPVSLNTDWLL